MKQKDIKELATNSITEKIQEEQANLTKLKLSHKVSNIENPLKIRVSRRTVARLKAELRKREIALTKTPKKQEWVNGYSM